MESKPTYNYVFVAPTDNDARSAAERIFSLENVDDHSVHHHNLFTVNVFYTSLENKYPVDTAPGFIDVLVVNVSNPESDDELRGYIRQKSLHGVRVVFSSNDSTSEVENIYEYSVDRLNDSSVQQLVANIAHRKIDTLRAAFRNVDSGNTGYIPQSELDSVLKAAGLVLSESYVYGENYPRVNFNQARAAYLTLGRDRQLEEVAEPERDAFRDLPEQIERVNAILSNTKVCSDSQGSTSTVEIGHTEEINQAIGVNLEVNIGESYKAIESSIPGHLKNDCFNVTLRVGTKDPSVVNELKALADNFRPLLLSDPKSEVMLSAGVNATVYNLDDTVNVELKLSEMMNEMLENVLNHLDVIEKVKGHSSLRIGTELSVTDLKELSLEEVIKKALKFRITEEGSSNHVSALLQIFVSIAELSNEMTGHNDEQVLKALKRLVLLIDTVSKAVYRVGVDCDKLSNTVSSAVPQQLKDTFEAIREEVLGNIEGMKDMLESILGPFKPISTALNFDNVSLIVSSSRLRLHLKLDVVLQGLSDALNELVLN